MRSDGGVREEAATEALHRVVVGALHGTRAAAAVVVEIVEVILVVVLLCSVSSCV